MRYDQQALEELRRNFDRESVETCICLAERDLTDIQNYLKAAREQLQVIDATQFRKEVYFERRKIDNRVWYFVGLRVIPNVPGGERLSYPVIGAKRFPGNERKIAWAYAEQLARKQGIEITR